MIPAHYQRGSLLFQQKRYRQAVEEFKLQLGLIADDSATHGMLALCLNELGNDAEASLHTRRAIHLAPDQAFGHFVLAHVFIRGNRLREAREAILEAIRLDPRNAEFFGILASLQIDKGQFYEALASTDRGLASQPENAMCINMRGLAMAHVGDGRASAAAMSQALAIRPDHAHTHASQGWALLRLSKIPPALEHFREALRIDPEFVWARKGLAEAIKSRNFIYRRLMGRSHLAPMFNLLLRIDRSGHHLLSSDQARGTNVTAAIVVAVLGCLISAVVARSSYFAYLTVMLALLSVIATAIYESRAGWPRRTIAAISLVLLVLIIGLPLTHMLDETSSHRPIEVTLVGCAFVLFWLMVGSRLAVNRLIRMGLRS